MVVEIGEVADRLEWAEWVDRLDCADWGDIEARGEVVVRKPSGLVMDRRVNLGGC